VKIQEVTSIEEALLLNDKINCGGDYSVLEWDNGRELVVESPDGTTRIRWIEKISSKVKALPTQIESVAERDIPSERNNAIGGNKVTVSGLQDSLVFTKKKGAD
jgi:hypothetical protein